jgi:7,8-dihydropterin-6-yl-methyl-4-(beta-D-ribofuranosyl)aminobenzene 5'-phosphate synthase
MNLDRKHIVKGMGKYNSKKITCNSCTGLVGFKRMVELRQPVVRGAARYGSKSELFVENGDSVEFG